MDKVKHLLESDELIVGISELSKITEASPRQFRYWEEQDYVFLIYSKDQGSRKYKLPMLVKDKNYLDEGYT